jgi:hypothetical protein
MPTRPHRILATSRRRGPPTRPELALLEQAMRRAASAAVVATNSSPVGPQLHPAKATPITSPSEAITGPGNPQRDITQHTVDNSSNELHEFDTIKDVLHRQLHGGLVCSCFSTDHQDVDNSGTGPDSGMDLEMVTSRYDTSFTMILPSLASLHRMSHYTFRCACGTKESHKLGWISRHPLHLSQSPSIYIHSTSRPLDIAPSRLRSVIYMSREDLDTHSTKSRY